MFNDLFYANIKSMLGENLEKIKAIEEKAAGIVRQTRAECAVALKNRHEKQEEEIRRAKDAAKKEAEAMVRDAEKAALEEVKKIEASARKEIEDMQRTAGARIETAKKGII